MPRFSTSNVQFRDFQGKMAVFFKQERKGRLIDIFESKDGAIRFVVMDGGDSTPVANLSAIDERLKSLFEKRVLDA